MNDDKPMVWSDLDKGGALMPIVEHEEAMQAAQEQIDELGRLVTRLRSSWCARFTAWVRGE
jgi:hypothetical protein